MQDTRKPSKSMIEKLLNKNGMKIKFSDYIRSTAINLCAPMLPSVTAERRIELVNSYFDENRSVGEFSEILSKYFSASEIMDLIAFYKTPTGQKIVQLEHRIAIDMLAIAQKIINEIIIKATKEGYRDTLDKLEEIFPEPE